MHEDFNLSDVEIESELALIKRKGDGIALSFQVGYEQAINHGEEKGSEHDWLWTYHRKGPAAIC